MGKRLHPEVQAPISYKLNQHVHNQYRGDIAEKVIHTYFYYEEIPRLKSQGWDMAFLEKVVFQLFYNIDYLEYEKIGSEKIKSLILSRNWSPEDWKKLQKNSLSFFLRKSMYPVKELEFKFLKLLTIVKNIIPDGFLFKIKKVDELTSKELRKKYHDVKGIDELITHSIDGVEQLIPIVDGKIELIEVKSNKDTIANDDKHRLMYHECLSNGFRIQWYNVEIISFEKNEFNINLKIYTPEDYADSISKKMK